MECEKTFANNINDKGLIFQNIQIAHTNQQQQQQKQPNQKTGRRPKQIFLQSRHTDGQKPHEEKCKSQLQNEVPPHINQNGHYSKSTNNKYWRECEEKGTLLHCQ